MNQDISIEQQVEKDSIVVYTKDTNGLQTALKQLEPAGFEIIIAKFERDIFDLNRLVFNTINKARPNLVLINSDESIDALILYKMIKDEGTFINLPVFFIGPKDDLLRMEVLRLGALQYIERPVDEEELRLLILNYIKVSNEYATSALHDELTGVYTRKYGERISEKGLEMAREKRQPFTSLVLDIDDMTAINVKLGKKKSDEIVKVAVEGFKKYLVPKEIIFRYSDERFVILFPNKEPAEVLEIANKMKKEMDILSSKYGIEISFTGEISALSRQNADFDSLMQLEFNTIKAIKQNNKGQIYINTSLDIVYKNKTLLFVDEDKVLLSILTTRYRNKGYEVFDAQSAEEALDIIKKENVSVTVTNFTVPGMAFSELMMAFHKDNRQNKILVLLSQRNEQSMDILVKSGANDFIVRPFSLMELDFRIGKLLEQR